MFSSSLFIYLFIMKIVQKYTLKSNYTIRTQVALTEIAVLIAYHKFYVSLRGYVYARISISDEAVQQVPLGLELTAFPGSPTPRWI